MANKPLKPCKKPMCPNLTQGTYCEQHREEQTKQTAENNRYYEQHKRDEQTAKFYNSRAWRVLSNKIYTQQHGLCQRCLREKKIVRGTTDGKGRFKRNIVDHIVPIKEDWSRRLDETNLQVLCISCHNKKTAREKGRGGQKSMR